LYQPCEPISLGSTIYTPRNPTAPWFMTSKARKSRMDATIEEDRAIVENIEYNKVDGKFNMRFDKLQNVYKTFYKSLVHNNTKGM
jgi:hypothetical protein